MKTKNNLLMKLCADAQTKQCIQIWWISGNIGGNLFPLLYPYFAGETWSFAERWWVGETRLSVRVALWHKKISEMSFLKSF